MHWYRQKLVLKAQGEDVYTKEAFLDHTVLIYFCIMNKFKIGWS